MTDLNGQSKLDAENGFRSSNEENTNWLKIFQTLLNVIAHICIGIVVGVALAFAFSNGLPLGATPMHIVLCVIGYQLLMAQSILSLSPHNIWSSRLKIVNKRRAHWIIQLVGSGLAIAGSFIKSLDKNVNWNTLHGQFALVALVFTIVCFVNGLTSLWANELRRFFPGKLSKLTHICFGIVAFVTAGISLCYGFDKGFFKNWAGEEFTYALMGLTAALTFILIVSPINKLSFWYLSMRDK